MLSRARKTPSTWRERWLMGQTLLLLPFLGASLKLFAFRRTYEWLARSARLLAPRPADDPELLPQAQNIAGLVLTCNRKYSLYEAACLPEALALWWQLRRQGLAADFCLGARTLTGRFEAHAWVEFAGTPVSDTSNIATIYAPFNLETLEEK